MPANTPRILWIELTSKCPLDCVFCSRKALRGAGEHMPYHLFESLVRQVSDPRTFLLNYSGESTVYPDLIPAIRLARSTGASVELVSALVNVPETSLPELCASGLTRLTVSVHTTDPARYVEIYRYGTFAALRSRLSRFLALCRETSAPPLVDLAFVAMDNNLADLPSVAAFARSLDLHTISIFPVIRRDEIPVHFPRELTLQGVPRPDFAARVNAALQRTAAETPEVSLTVCNPAFTTDSASGKFGEVPRPYPGPLPPGARIYSCEQNPWETAHVLSSGDVVACEVLDKIPLGNLHRQSLPEIWHGEPYRAFRERYRQGEVPECQSCPWKQAYRPGPLQSDIIAARGPNAQLLHGWHSPIDRTHIWASRQAVAEIAPRDGSRVLHVSGLLPPGPPDHPNELVIHCNQVEIGRVANPWAEMMPFGLDFPVPPDQPAPWSLQFRTRHLYRPGERGAAPDQRDLGFALVLLTSKAFVDPEVIQRSKAMLQPVPRLLRAIDAAGALAGRCFPFSRADSPALTPGLSVLIPERDNVAELADCLASVRAAAAQWTEPLEVLVIVNGSPPLDYQDLRAEYPEVRWQFTESALGFSGAVNQGLRLARFDWVYLLNSDVVLDPAALREVGSHRKPGVFSIASQIHLKDETRFREETNWGALFLENGVVTIHDWIPHSSETVPGFYSGGAASLFQTRLLRRFARGSAYQPFYWEDVEWGWRARKLGYRSLFCPRSVAHHTQRSTIARHYLPADVDRIWQRNRYLFQLRNLTSQSAENLSQWRDQVASTPGALARYFLRPSTWWKVACGRLWNHRAPLPDEEILTEWNTPS